MRAKCRCTPVYVPSLVVKFKVVMNVKPFLTYILHPSIPQLPVPIDKNSFHGLLGEPHIFHYTNLTKYTNGQYVFFCI